MYEWYPLRSFDVLRRVGSRSRVDSLDSIIRSPTHPTATGDKQKDDIQQMKRNKPHSRGRYRGWDWTKQAQIDKKKDEHLICVT